MRAIAMELGRSPSTVSREIRRNIHQPSGNYRPRTAQRNAGAPARSATVYALISREQTVVLVPGLASNSARAVSRNHVPLESTTTFGTSMLASQFPTTTFKVGLDATRPARSWRSLMDASSAVVALPLVEPNLLYVRVTPSQPQNLQLALHFPVV
ncbi:helix-turn-helix domain-containing protein [Paenarthrobacter sp. NPDC092416]|uniref:helix-turn-helix domain-containing protein n=1 Tax=Paenarthrobacter sp. NPDC092416 TaxID=3364386 RepID=UPI00380EC8AF